MEQIERLAALCDKMIALNKRALPAGLSQEALIERIRGTTALLKELTKESNELFTNEIRPALSAAHLLSDAEEYAFFAIAQKLSSFKSHIDTGMALSIYQALLRKARWFRNRDGTLKYLYWCGITLYYSNENKAAEILAYFQEGADYLAEYDTLESKETRRYVHRCMGNTVMMTFHMDEYEKARQAFTRTLAFFNELAYDGTDADYPWESYFLSCMNHYRQYFTKKMHSDPASLTKDEIRNIFRISLMISKIAERSGRDGTTAVDPRYELALWEAQFVAGQISIANFRDNVQKAIATYKPDDYSAEAMHTNVMFPCYVIFYTRKMLPDNEENNLIIKEQLAHITGYMRALPHGIDPGTLATYITLFLRGTAGLMPEKEHLDWVVKLTTYRHKPTFAHTITVSKLMRLLTREYIAKHPGHFIGIYGTQSEADVEENVEKLIDLAEDCGLCHDVGKLQLIRNQTTYARIFAEDEKYLVEEHVREGLRFFQESIETEDVKAYRDVMNGHHVYYDGSAGYPNDFELSASPYKALVHTATVADSLDSGTDDIGKTYADAKPLQQVVDEIIDGAGTRYSPYIAEMLKDDGLVARIREAINTVRPDAYYAAYRFVIGEE